MAYEFDCAWCGKHVFVSKYHGQPTKYCSDQCRRESSNYKKRERRKNEKKKKPSYWMGNPDSEQNTALVPIQQCAKCRYSQLVGQFLVCGYFEFTGQTRTSRHPEGLTADCREFRPRARARKKIPIKVNG